MKATLSTAARISILFGSYAMAMGLLCLFVPNALLGVLGIAPTSEVWIHILGAIALGLGMYYVQAGRHELVPFFRISIVGRLVFAACVSVCAVLWKLPVLFIFAGIDAAGAAWTAWALRAQ